MPFEFKKTDIEGVIVITPKVFKDDRGFFLETYKKDDFEKGGIKCDFIQDNHSKSKKGVVRGIHYQENPYSQAKLIRCIKGAIWDIAVDLRKESKTFGKFFAIELSEKNKKMLFIPKGCGHGFESLTEDTEMEYKNDNFYNPVYEKGIRWDDPKIKINWPIKNPIVSKKDEILQSFEDFKKE